MSKTEIFERSYKSGSLAQLDISFASIFKIGASRNMKMQVRISAVFIVKSV